MQYKHISHDVKDLDEAKGVVKAYANTYDVKDADGDISAQGSFNKSVKENFQRIRVLKDHDRKISLGVPLEIDTKDSYGLLTVSQFNMKKEVARDMFTDIVLMKEHGLNPELSIGYQVVGRDVRNKSRITEYLLKEYSFLTAWAANKFSTVEGVKEVKDHYGVLNLLEKMYNLNYSDSRLKQIESILISLKDEEPSDKQDTTDFEPIVKQLSTFKLF